MGYGVPQQAPGLASSGQRAISAALAPRATGSAWFGGWGSDALGRFLAGPHGEPDWSVANPGLSTPTLIGGSVMIPAASAPRQVAPAVPVAQPGERFLQDRGQSTAGLTAGQIANNLNKSLSGGSSQHGGGFGV
jgi:hypothetical protein